MLKKCIFSKCITFSTHHRDPARQIHRTPLPHPRRNCSCSPNQSCMPPPLVAPATAGNSPDCGPPPRAQKTGNTDPPELRAVPRGLSAGAITSRRGVASAVPAPGCPTFAASRAALRSPPLPDLDEASTTDLSSPRGLSPAPWSSHHTPLVLSVGLPARPPPG